MKKVLFLIIAVLSSFSMFAQEKMVITTYDHKETKINVWDIRNIQFVIDTVTTSYSEPDSIDLGLSVRWGSFNLGASTAEESGKLFGWGSLYDFMHTTMAEFYPCKEPPTSIVCSSYDVANVELGGLWRMPTTEEIQELIDSCEWEWNKEPSGWYVRRNGAEIFMPITYKRYGDNIDSTSVAGYYWSGDLAEDTSEANALFFSDNDSCTIVQDFRYMGFAIRPVYGEYIPETSLSIKDNDKTTNTSISVNIGIEGGMDNIEECGIIYGTTSELDINSSSKKTLDISTLKKENSIELNGLDFLTTYYIKAYVLVDGEYIYTDMITITTEPNYPVPEYVDLGLSVKWATWNMGAKRVGDYGGYYNWGDPYNKNSSAKMSDITNSEYDMPHIQWKDEWRMPTKKEWDELYNNCTWEYIKNYDDSLGLNGMLVTGPNNNSIFLPLGGNIQNDGSSWQKGVYGYYWTSNANKEKDFIPYRSVFMTSYFEIKEASSMSKSSIRAVYGPVNNENPDVDDSDPEVSDSTNTDLPEAIDLGLGVKWANKNIGAKNIEDFGKYFFWGDKDTIRTDYSPLPSYEDIPADIKGTEYDVANNIYGKGWRLPNQAEIDQLINLCDWQWTSVNGVDGFKVSNREKPENFIFLPACGWIFDGNKAEIGEAGYYWSSELYFSESHRNDYAWNLYFCTGLPKPMLQKYYRDSGYCIRAVCP